MAINDKKEIKGDDTVLINIRDIKNCFRNISYSYRTRQNSPLDRVA